MRLAYTAGRPDPSRLCARVAVALCVLVVLVGFVGGFPAGAWGEQASEPTLAVAGGLDAGGNHACGLLADANVRCWGFNGDGQLGYGNRNTIGDDETPASVGPVNLGPGRTATAISAGDYHTCGVLDDGTVRCWGFGADGRLGYGTANSVEAPGSGGPVDVGAGRSARAISSGGAHTCAVLDDATVRCWGFGFSGQLGYGNKDSIGEHETPGSVGPVDLGAGRTARAISVGGRHTCAVLDNGSVRCWGVGGSGRLGYGNQTNIGDVQTPGSVAPVDLGLGRTAKAISAGGAHTCAVLDDGSVRCWGFGASGQLGYGNQTNVGDTPATTPDKVGPVDLGLGRTAKAISAGSAHTCALLDNGSVRCWGYNLDGRLGDGNTNTIGDDETPGSAGPVDLGPGRTAVAISAGQRHTCARLDNGTVRCWGYGGNGRLGYCNQEDIGDNEAPGSAGPVNLAPGDGGVICTSSAPISPPTASITGAPQGTSQASAVGSDAMRARGLRSCLSAVTAHATRERRLSRRGSARQRAKVRRHLSHHARQGRRRCLRLFGRTPGRITALRARTLGKTQIELDFNAAGTDANHPPPAHSYVIKQSLRPIVSARGFSRADTLCKGACRFSVLNVGGKVTLTVTDLRPHTTYYYAVAARDNVSAKRGQRSKAVKAKTH